MKLILGISASREVDTEPISQLSKDFDSHFSNKSYGDSINNLNINIICVSKDFEAFFKVNRPKFFKMKKMNGIDGYTYTLDKVLFFDLRIDFKLYQETNIENKKSLIVTRIIDDLNYILNTKKLSSFNISSFKSDLMEVLKL